ncbi:MULTISPECIES: DUF1707 SHOCT-like domain-containing protein [Prauserella salsuginis group]|uniref:DUF1707 domain-containing protein n=1 Tax=Prauserella salsuginis TaxID=387889 RepID=A0ABW6G6W3_9PSEU|nr:MULTISPECIES: DUF1707 domain-containing protein [Prauserella salsuginis group]MCR3722667.1 protein of unknown function (DUF1707) [Prauserella flava]MCR3737278.1 protein of unknown function (DUF1707) [Prauserella salsuginis]
MAADRSELRLSDAERQEALDALSEHVRTGRLELTEFDERSVQVSGAKFRKDLKPLFADLPEPRPSVLEHRPRQESGMSRVNPPAAAPVQPWRQRLASAAVPVAAVLAIALFFVTRAGFFVFLIPAAAALLAGLIVNRR